MNFMKKIKPATFWDRQIILSELGLKGQKKLLNSKVTIVGVGGLGSASTIYLTLAGIGSLRIVDKDVVELNNLHRQILYNLNDLHSPKVEVARQKIKMMIPEIRSVKKEKLSSDSG